MEREHPLVQLRDLWTRLATVHEQAAQDARSAGDRIEAWRCSVRANVYRQCAADLDVELESIEAPTHTADGRDGLVQDLLALLQSWTERLDWLDGLLRQDGGDVGWRQHVKGSAEQLTDCRISLMHVLKRHGVIPRDDG